MSTPKAAIFIEGGQTLRGFHTLTDSGNHIKFSSQYSPWSLSSGKEYEVIPDGLATGGLVSPASSGGNDKVDVAGMTAYLAGVLITVLADTDVSITRGLTTDTHIINSITIDDNGDIVVIAGTDSTAFSDTRGAAGGPPFIPVGSIEIAQIHLTSITSAPIEASEILSVIGQHTERYDYPTWEETPLKGEIEFSTELPLSHTGNVSKGVYAKVYTPIYQQLNNGNSFVHAEESVSINSTTTYDGTVGASTTSLGQGSFTVILKNGHTDPIISMDGDNRIIKFKADKNRTPYSLTQGIVNVKRTYPAGGQMVANITVSAESKSVDFSV